MTIDLAAWRHLHGLSQSRAAAALGVPLRTFQEWEQGRRAPNNGLLARTMAYFDKCGPLEALEPLPGIQPSADASRPLRHFRKPRK